MTIAVELPVVMPQAVLRVRPDGTPTEYQINWESLLRDLAQSALIETEARVATAEANISTLDTFTISLQSQVNTNAANLVIEATTRANADAAEAALRIALEASVNSNFASVNTTLVSLATTDSALAASITTLNTTVGGHSATLSIYGASINGLQLRFGVTGYLNGATGGFVFTGVLQNDGSAVFNMEFNSNVTINGNLVVNGTVTYPKVATNSLSSFYSAQVNTPAVLGAGAGWTDILAIGYAGTDAVQAICDIIFAVGLYTPSSGNLSYPVMRLWSDTYGEIIPPFFPTYTPVDAGGNVLYGGAGVPGLGYTTGSFKRAITNPPGSDAFRLQARNAIMSGSGGSLFFSTQNIMLVEVRRR